MAADSRLGRLRRLRPAAAVLLVAAVFTACQDNETAVARGDRLWADSNYTGALAEYRLAVAQRGDDEALLRLAHAYAHAGQLDDARSTYDQLLARNPDQADQAVYDYLRLADRALARGDDLDAATAVDAALALRPELTVPAAALRIARYYRGRGDLQRALAYYYRALAALPADSAPQLLYEIGVIQEEQERCDLGLDYFRAAREQGEKNPRKWRSLLGEARWHTGNCSFRLAQQARDRGEVSEALGYLETMISLGEPENLLDQAWFERGELLYGVGRFDEALAAYRKVLERNPARTGQLVERAQKRIDDIRFGVLPSDTTG